MRLSIRSSGRRHGFSLIELLVVCGIIAVLVALAAGAYFKVAQGQNQKRSETTIKKVATGLNSQWSAVIDDVKTEIKNGYPPLLGNVPGTQNTHQDFVNQLFTFAGGDRDRANALYLKMRLIQEFPQIFNEATNNVILRSNANPAVYIYLPPKKFYVESLSGVALPGATTLQQAKLQLQMQSAILLYINLTQSRRGASFNAEDIGAGSKAVLSSAGNLTVFIDAWGNPLGFERWSAASVNYNINGTTVAVPAQQLTAANLTELSSPPYAAASQALNYDPQDPSGRLLNWSLAITQPNPPNPSNPSTAIPQFDGQNRSPVVYSMGQDGVPATADDLLGFRLLIEGQRGN